MNNNDPESLAQLIEQCKKGKRDAQERIFRMMYGKMLVSCLKYFPNEDQAKDILQEGFIKVFGKINKYDHQGSFEGWVRRIVVNTAIDAIRRSKRFQLTSIEESEYDWLEAEDDSELEWNEVLMREKERVLEAIQNLTPAYRAVFNMYVIEDYSHREIAEQLGISEGTSKSNLAKAKMNLKKALGELQY